MRPIIAFLLPLLMMGCQAADLPQRHLILGTSPALAPFARDLATRFQLSHPDVRIDVTTEPADGVIADTRQGLIDVALVGRSFRANETDLQGTVVAQDGIAFIVHRSNPVSSLDERQLVSLLNHSYTDWREVGGSAGPVHLFGLGEGLALRESLLNRFGLAKNAVGLDPPLYSGEQVVEAVAANPAALGYLSLAEARKASAGQSIRVLPQGGVEATVQNLRNGSYPFTRPLMMAARPEGNELNRELIEFAASPAAHDLIESHGFAPAPP